MCPRGMAVWVPVNRPLPLGWALVRSPGRGPVLRTLSNHVRTDVPVREGSARDGVLVGDVVLIADSLA